VVSYGVPARPGGSTLNNSRRAFIWGDGKFYVSAAQSDAFAKHLQTHDIRAAKLNRA
jgi:hypothetical protein